MLLHSQSYLCVIDVVTLSAVPKHVGIFVTENAELSTRPAVRRDLVEYV